MRRDAPDPASSATPVPDPARLRREVSELLERARAESEGKRTYSLDEVFEATNRLLRRKGA